MGQTSEVRSDLVNIFISHKTEDGDAALYLKERLELLGSNRILGFVSEEITPGAAWKDWIKERIGESSILVLLFTRSTASWDWCLYETGLFSALDKGAVIVIHGEEDDPPSPLKDIQAIEATPDKIASFLKNLFGESSIKGINPPEINPRLASNPKLLESEAKKICEFFKGVKEQSRLYAKRMVLKIPQLGKDELSMVPDDSIVTAEKDTLSMFGLSKRLEKVHWTWGDLKRHQKGKDWLNGLQTSILKAHKSEIFDDIQSTLHTPIGQVFRPVLDRLEIDPAGTRHYHVFFVEQVTEGASVHSPEAHATLLTSLTLGSRFQWELCDNYIYQVGSWEDADLDDNLSRLKSAFDNIQREADFRKQLEFRRPENRDRLVWAFKTRSDQNKVDRNLADQRIWKEKFLQSIKNKDKKLIVKCLQKLQVLNMQLIVQVAKRYEELLMEVPLEVED